MPIRERITGLKANAAESLKGTDSPICKIERSLDVIGARLRKHIRGASFGMRKARLHS
jgi:hypothetical protein